MNADYQSFEPKLAQWQPARLTAAQHRRLQNRIAAQLPTREPPAVFRWQLWLGWTVATAVLALMLLALNHGPKAIPEGTRADQLIVSNLWPVQVGAIEDAGSSNVRQNQFYYSISDSRLPTGFSVRKI